MALQEQVIAIPFAGGVDTKSDDKQVPPAKLRLLENGVFTKNATISKRNGYESLSQALDAGGSYESPKRLAARDGELLLFANDRMYSFRESSDSWSLIGLAQSIVHTEVAIARTGTEQTDGDAATLNGLSVVAWEDSRGGVWWSVVEQRTGRVLRASEQLLSTGQRPRVVACGDRIHVYYAEPANFRIWVIVVNTDDYLASVTPVILVDDLSTTNPAFDAERTNRTVNPAVMAWARQGGGYRVGYVDPSGVLGSVSTGHPGVATHTNSLDGPISVSWSPEDNSGNGVVGVAWGDGTEVQYHILQADDLNLELDGGAVLSCDANPSRIATVWTSGPDSGFGGGIDFWVWAEQPSGGLARNNSVRAGFIELSGSIAGDAITDPVRGHGLGSRGFTDDNGVYVMFIHEVPFFPYAALMRWYTEADDSTPLSTCVGRLLVGVSDGMPNRSHLPSVEVDADDDRIHRWIAPYREQVDAAAVGTVATPAIPQFNETALRIVTMDFDHPDAFRSAQLGRDLVIAGAVPLRYDGDTVAELGFHTAPDDTITVTPGAGGSLSVSSTYLYAYSYDEIDAQGEIHRGPLSVGTLVETSGAQNRTTHAIPTYRLTSKRQVRINVWRSEADDTNAVDPTLYRVSSLDPAASSGSNRYVANDTTVDTVTFVDDMADAAILTKERAYVTGGILSNDPAPLSAVVVSGKNRLFFLDPTNPHAVRFTQERQDGFGPEVVADLSLAVDPYGGNNVALGVLDDKVIVFKDSAIYFFAGPGPLANPDSPNSGGFSPPALVTTDVGCSSAASVAITPGGLVFQSSKGIYRLGRNLQVEYIGADVERFNAQRITHAALLSDRQSILFLAETGGTTLHFDYENNQWSTFTNHTGLDGALVNGVYHYLRSDERVFREDVDSFRDDNQSIRMAMETAWLHLAQYLQGWQWFYYVSLIGTYKGSHTLRMYMRLDYESGWGEPFNLNVDGDYNPALYGEGNYGAGVYGGSDDTHDTRYQKQVHIGAPGQAISFRFEDIQSSGDLEDAYELSELLLTGGIIQPKALLGPSRRS